jgi:hypothetical protein
MATLPKWFSILNAFLIEDRRLEEQAQQIELGIPYGRHRWFVERLKKEFYKQNCKTLWEWLALRRMPEALTREEEVAGRRAIRNWLSPVPSYPPHATEEQLKEIRKLRSSLEQSARDHTPSAANTPAGEVQATAPAAHDPTFPRYVTLDQMAASVSRSKRTLEKRKGSKKDPLPSPDVKGGGGKPDEWLWERVRPWLEREFGRKLPGQFPGDRFHDGQADRS